MLRTKNKSALFLCMILVFSLLLCGCSAKEDSEQSRALCENMVDCIIRDDYASAYAMIQTVASQDEFDPLWHAMRDSLKNSASYELQQKNWYKEWSNGVTVTRVLFEITTDDGKICQMLVSTRDGIDGIAGVNFLDSTDFVQKTDFLNTVNIFLILYSVACFAFSIWMLIDCLKRCRKHKILWAILTLLYIGFTVTGSTSAFNVNFRVSLLTAITSISADRTALAISFTAFLPIGAIIYCIMRKRLSRSDEQSAENEIAGESSSELSDENETQA